MKAIIHIGTEKTGTTTIQQFLRDRRDLMQSYGYAYPITPGEISHIKLAYYAKNKYKQDDVFIRMHNLNSPQRLEEWKKRFRSRLSQEISQLKPGIHTVIFSSEHLHSRLWGESELKNLELLLKPWFDEVEVLVYLRRQDRLAVSLYSTKLKVGRAPDKILNMNVDPHSSYYNYRTLLNNWSSVFGRSHIRVRLFEPNSFHNGDLISDFVAATGFSECGPAERHRKLNEKLSWQSQHLMLRYNKKYPISDGVGYNEFNQKVGKKLLKILEARYPGKEELPLRDEAMSFYELFRADNQLVAREWFDRETLFDEDFSGYPAHKVNLKLTPVDILRFEIAVKLERYKHKLARSFLD